MKLKASFMVLAACAALAAAGPVAAQTKTKTPVATQQSGVGIAVERPLTAAVLKQEFPADFAALDAGFGAAQGGAGSTDAKLLATSKLINEYRARFVADVRNAPDELLKPVIQALADLHVAVEAREATEICGEFTLNGTADIFNKELGAAYASELDALSAAYLKAVAGGIDSPTGTTAAEAEDWAGIAKLVVQQGTPQSYLDAIVSADPSNPQMCKGMIDLLQALVDMPGEGGHRLRAELAVSASLY